MRPTKPGFYWARLKQDNDWNVVKVFCRFQSGTFRVHMFDCTLFFHLADFEWGEEIPPRWDATERDARVKGEKR